MKITPEMFAGPWEARGTGIFPQGQNSRGNFFWIRTGGSPEQDDATAKALAEYINGLLSSAAVERIKGDAA